MERRLYRCLLTLMMSVILVSGCARQEDQDDFPVPLSEVPAKRGVWTLADQDTAVNAFLAGTADDPSKLIELADALRAAGNDARTKEILVKAGSSLTHPWARASIAERLIELGDEPDAEALTPVDAALAARVVFLSALGTGRARVGNIDGARRAAAAIASLLNPLDVPERKLSERSDAMRAFSFGLIAMEHEDDFTRMDDSDLTEATANIAIAMATAGAADDASMVVGGLPDGLAKLRFLSEAAWRLCDVEHGQGSSHEKGRELARQATAVVLRLIDTSDDSSAKATLAATAARAIARCDGPSSAIAFVRDKLEVDLANRSLAKLVRQLAYRRALAIAHEIVPALEPIDVESLLDAMRALYQVAFNLAKEGDRATAKMTAIDMKRIAAKIPRDAIISTPPALDNRDVLDLEIFTAFAMAGADESAPVRPTDIHYRSAAYESALPFDMLIRDAAATRRIVSKILDEARSLRPPKSAPLDVAAQLATMLAIFGYEHQAREIYDEYFGTSEVDGAATSLQSLEPRFRGPLKAALGDIPGAITAANEAGPLVKDAPSVSATAPLRHSVPGASAPILLEIVEFLAIQGRIPEAFEVEAELEAGGTDLDSLIASALASIAATQFKIGQPQGALATALRIPVWQQKVAVLLELATIPTSL